MDLLNFRNQRGSIWGEFDFCFILFYITVLFWKLIGCKETPGDLISFEKFAHLDSSESVEFKQRLLLKKTKQRFSTHPDWGGRQKVRRQNSGKFTSKWTSSQRKECSPPLNKMANPLWRLSVWNLCVLKNYFTVSNKPGGHAYSKSEEYSAACHTRRAAGPLASRQQRAARHRFSTISARFYSHLHLDPEISGKKKTEPHTHSHAHLLTKRSGH